jgi:hypothetical protein
MEQFAIPEHFKLFPPRERQSPDWRHSTLQNLISSTGHRPLATDH